MMQSQFPDQRNSPQRWSPFPKLDQENNTVKLKQQCQRIETSISELFQELDQAEQSLRLKKSTR